MGESMETFLETLPNAEGQHSSLSPGPPNRLVAAAPGLLPACLTSTPVQATVLQSLSPGSSDLTPSPPPPSAPSPALAALLEPGHLLC